MAQTQRTISVLPLPPRQVAAKQPLQDSLPKGKMLAWVYRHFDFPKGELAVVTEDGAKISLPTPLLGALIALFIWLAGGTLAGVWLVATMSSNVQNLTNSMIQYQARTDAEKKAMQDKIDLQQVYITDLREKVIELKARRVN